MKLDHEELFVLTFCLPFLFSQAHLFKSTSRLRFLDRFQFFDDFFLADVTLLIKLTNDKSTKQYNITFIDLLQHLRSRRQFFVANLTRLDRFMTTSDSTYQFMRIRNS